MCGGVHLKHLKDKTNPLLVPQVWLGLISSWNVSLWCYDLNYGGPFDPSPEFVGHRVFVNRKHSCTSRGEKLKHMLPLVWPLNSCHLLQTLPGREKAKLVSCDSTHSSQPDFQLIFSSSWQASPSEGVQFLGSLRGAGILERRRYYVPGSEIQPPLSFRNCYRVVKLCWCLSFFLTWFLYLKMGTYSTSKARSENHRKECTSKFIMGS